MWEQLAADTRRYGELPAVVEGPYSISFVRPFAPGILRRARGYSAVQRKRKLQYEQQERSDLLELAEKIEDVVRLRQSCRKAQHPQQVPSPTGPLPELPQEAEARRALSGLGERRTGSGKLPRKSPRASRIGTGAESPSASAGRVVERESAINHEIWACSCRRWSTVCTECCGKPHYDAVSMITNIAFPDANVTSEDVRSACRRRHTGRQERCTQSMK